MDNPPNDALRKLAELYQQGRMQELLSAGQPLLLQFPNSVPLLTLMGVANAATGKTNQARAAFDKLTQLSPNDADAHNNLGIALRSLGRGGEAITSFERALAVRPSFPEALNNLGNALRDSSRQAEAVDAYQRALALKPAYADALSNMAAALVDLRRRDEAIACYTRVLEINPGNSAARAERLRQQAHICDWEAITADAASIPQLGVEGEPLSPFAMLALEDAPARHRIRSERYARKKFAYAPMPERPRPAARPERLRIGYFSADFHDHATMHLMAKLFEAHDRSRFSLYAYSYGPDTGDAIRKRAETAFDVFRDVRTESDESVAHLARKDGIDIAVDLKGYTTGGRLGVLAHRPAPVQVSYIGYPGTIGAPFIDYIIADRVVIPEAMRQHYSESVIFLPDSYQVNDNGRVISDRPVKRAEVGLPEDAFIFCCFNNTFKISPAEFDIWMRLLNAIDRSVLWLFEANQWAAENLRRHARARGVDPARIIFAGRMPQAEHLARHRLADLFLDTFIYNAHTTASDALWAGVPLIAKAGEGFAARVAASLLNAIGLPEMVAHSEADYERVALELARAPAKLAAIKAKLAANRLTTPLFDTEQFARHLEWAYDQIFARYLASEPPQDVVIER